jgi:hypothetical protein
VQDSLLFDGHFVQVADGDDRLLATSVPGKLLGKSKQQTFCKTTTTLEFGMCGGPVTGLRPGGSSYFAGLVEGIVPKQFTAASRTSSASGRPSIPNGSLQEITSAMAGAAVFIEAADLQELF